MAREKKEAPASSGPSAEDAFAVMFTSLNLILLSFFILLNSIAIQDAERSRKALGSMRGTFGILTGGENPSREGDHLLRSDQIKGGSMRRNATVAETKEILRRAGLFDGSTNVVVVPTADGLRIDFTDKVFFRSGTTELDPRVFPFLDQLGSAIKKTNRPIVVRGFTDPIKPKRYPSNLTLSALRAAQVGSYLAEAVKVPPQLVRIEGKGVRSESGSARVVEIHVPSDAFKAPLVQPNGRRSEVPADERGLR